MPKAAFMVVCKTMVSGEHFAVLLLKIHSMATEGFWKLKSWFHTKKITKTPFQHHSFFLGKTATHFDFNSVYTIPRIYCKSIISSKFMGFNHIYNLLIPAKMPRRGGGRAKVFWRNWNAVTFNSNWGDGGYSISLKIWFPEIQSQDVSLSLLVVVFEFCCDFDINRLAAILPQTRQTFSNHSFWDIALV